MMNNREQHQKFLNMELIAETEEFDKKFSAKALYLLNESEDLFMGQFLKFDNGEMIVRFRATRSFPRKGEYTQVMYLPSKIQDYRQWGDKTYEDLFRNRIKGSEAICIWHAKSNEEGFVLLGFRGIDIDFAKYISQAPGALIVFGPNKPPIDYLANLYRLLQDTYSQAVSDIIDYDYRPVTNMPVLIREEQPFKFIYKQISSSEITILQGPPGTGKTQLIAELCAKLCSEGKSVLITALTNRALVEVASKEVARELLEQGSIYKSNLTVDEQKELPKLVPLKQLLPIKGALVMATYYIVSGFAANLTDEGIFDVVIMDEASQALLAMFAASNKIGKRQLWVGDTAQLGPVLSLNDNRVKSNLFDDFKEGFRALTTKRIYPTYQLTATYRLTQRSANYTGYFYNGTLVSKSTTNPIMLNSFSRLLHANGGPTLVLTDMEVGDAAPRYAVDMATYFVYAILKEQPQIEIAVLTCLRKTTRELQKAIALRLGLGNKVIIETIARVQGLTTDITLFFIPNTSLNRSLEARLFNVATSRAKSHTIIIADKNILNYMQMSCEVRSFFEKLNTESCIYVPQQMEDHRILLD